MANDQLRPIPDSLLKYWQDWANPKDASTVEFWNWYSQVSQQLTTVIGDLKTALEPLRPDPTCQTIESVSQIKTICSKLPESNPEAAQISAELILTLAAAELVSNEKIDDMTLKFYLDLLFLPVAAEEFST